MGEVRTMTELINKVDTSSLMMRPLSDWRPLLSQECQVYVFGESYLAKRFDQINYKFCGKNEAKEILIDNLYALLRYKYFTQQDEEIDERIQKIVSSFTANLKSTLKKVSFDIDTDSEKVYMLPNYCIAFRNGVYDFKNNKWLFKYDIITVKSICNKIYMYAYNYIIFWYMDLEFKPLEIDITTTSLEKFIQIMKISTKKNRNYCFELLYNMSHDTSDEFSMNMFRHLCEILGYTIMQDFSQHFVFFVGSGQNGKNSLFDGCFIGKVKPTPAANALTAIENDKFITGALENKYQNIFLESGTDTYTDSKMLKALTGSMYQTIENKGIDKYSSIINCKYIWSANDQEKLKFSDTTPGFIRRVNLMEVWYRWDAAKRFLKRGDYYDTTFSDTFIEIKNDIMNSVMFIYFGMYGIMEGTKNFTSNFKFTYNDWKMRYTDVDFELREKIESVSPEKIVKYIKSSDSKYSECKPLLYSYDKARLYASNSLKELGYVNYDDMISMLSNPEAYTQYFAEYDFYINLKLLQKIIGDLTPATSFTQSVKKLYSLTNCYPLYNNQPYVKATFVGRRLRIIK